jgi:hypothetical protein
MKKIGSLFVIALIFSVLNSLSAQNTIYVQGHTKKNGTYVQPYYKTSPNATKLDNFSTKPNLNPYTGKTGTIVVPESNLFSQPNISVPNSSSYEYEDVATQCLGTTRSGNQCRRMTKNASGYCYQHE